MLGATIFWISGFTALPPIHNALTTTAAQNGAYVSAQFLPHVFFFALPEPLFTAIFLVLPTLVGISFGCDEPRPRILVLLQWRGLSINASLPQILHSSLLEADKTY